MQEYRHNDKVIMTLHNFVPRDDTKDHDSQEHRKHVQISLSKETL
jgi:hypothetical protein